MIRKCPRCKDLVVPLALLGNASFFVCRRCKAKIRLAPQSATIWGMVGLAAGLAAAIAVGIKIGGYSRHLFWVAIPFPFLVALSFARLQVAPDPSPDQADSNAHSTNP